MYNNGTWLYSNIHYKSRLKASPNKLKISDMIRQIIFFSVIAMFSLAIFACDKKEDHPISTGSDMLLGSWINPQYNESTITFEKSMSLVDNQYGLSFEQNTIFIKRKNSGWCGTPPISYADYTGTWMQNDSIISIKVGYWGGTLDYSWKIVAVNQVELTIANLD